MRPASLLSFLTIASFLADSGIAFAQTNEVYVGQTGETNRIRIDQNGNGNVVGGNADTLRLTQDGLGNVIAIDQTGFGNKVATNSRDGVRPSLGLIEIGTGQSGNRNQIIIEQISEFTDAASNVLEAVRQVASASFGRFSPFLSNSLTLRQTVAAGPDDATQAVGQVIQINDSAAPFAGVTNVVSITQEGDGSGAGNVLVTAFQEGSGNSLTTTQSEGGNRIETSRQNGTSNTLTIGQSLGDRNIVVAVDQAGHRNRADLTQAGTENFIENVVQGTAGIASTGNLITLTLAGDGNGGDGRNGAGRFALAPASFGVLQASISQFGDGNMISYVTGANSDGNLFGFLQDGAGNAITGVVEGAANEAVARQEGEDNALVFEQSGDRNALSARFDGRRNASALGQQGIDTLVRLEIDGDDNNTSRSGGFGNDALAVASAVAGLAAGEIRQEGTLNGIDFLVSGNRNAFAVLQSGARNLVTAVVTGSANRSVVIQDGNGNIAGFSQTGDGNRLLVRQ
ncbi:hypothetical protein [Aurantimonas marianensis]|uniref:Curlin associated repeat-containing protein n=1 Tax=Aurantimonas marianensis TaxID=2920428 RepID=A0A9X2KH82_9HYPH|nr:hypothetical protein [Aurantimonas marianensis]MCP3054447.1 hypothetical protein [Aurantimonas marianensis]